jgi:hypothetical protein
MNSQNYREREILGKFYTLFQQMLEDEKRFYIYFRMTKDCFNDILNLIGDDVRKEYTNYRSPIPPEERLAIVLR